MVICVTPVAAFGNSESFGRIAMTRVIEITELALRDAHQSLLATRMALDDMVPACEDLDKAGYWSVECWGGATFDSCIRFLNEDPWERLRTLRKLMPKRSEERRVGKECRSRWSPY